MIIKKTKSECKKWYTSKMLWTGALMVCTAIMDALVNQANWKACLLAGFGALVIYLRTITTKELSK